MRSILGLVTSLPDGRFLIEWVELATEIKSVHFSKNLQ